MMLVASICLSAVALILMIRKKYLSADSVNAKVTYRAIAVRRAATSFAIVLSLYLSYRLEVYDFPYTLVYFIALPTVWVYATIVFWNVVEYLDRREKQIAASQVVKPANSRAYPQQSPVDKIYAWETQQQGVQSNP